MFVTLYYIEIEEILLKHKKETFLLSERLNIRIGCPEVVESPSWEIFKTWLEKALNNLL